MKEHKPSDTDLLVEAVGDVVLLLAPPADPVAHGRHTQPAQQRQDGEGAEPGVT